MGEMTNEQAARWLKDLLKSDLPMEQYQTAIEKGIEALEPSGDLISRAETLTAFADYVGSGMSMNDYEALWNIVTKMPSVKQEPCDDAISRQAVLDIVNNPLNIRLDEIIKKLPPVTPQPKTGYWEQYGDPWEDKFKCSECGKEQPKILCGQKIIGHWSDYCPNCGCRMVEPQESEV